VITIRINDHVEGKYVVRTVEYLATAIALLMSLFDRPEFDPWNAVWPPANGDAPTDHIRLTHEAHVNGDVTVTVDRIWNTDDEEVIPS
jgi:hypothetical protein